MNRKAKVLLKDCLCGILSESDEGFVFAYTEEWLAKEDKEPVSLTLPLRKEPYLSKTLFPFFDGLIPEGWLLQIVSDNWKISQNDRMGLLLLCCQDPIGAVSILPSDKEDKGV
jgi:serine/threonine-protein kinase HipA